MRLLEAAVSVLLLLDRTVAFVSPCSRRPSLALSSQEWSIGDDWDKLSHENPSNTAPDSREIFNQDFFQRQANIMEDGTKVKPLTTEEKWLQSAIDQIVSDGQVSDEEQTVFEEELGDEIARLVRCNENPQNLLIEEGRAVAPLTKEERFDPAQLVSFVDGEWLGTEFFNQAVARMFEKHCNDNNVMDARGVASWMGHSLKEGVVGPHDRRVTSTLSIHGTYQKGYLTLDNFQSLYLKAAVGETAHKSERAAWRYVKGRSAALKGVWRDLRNHGVLPPSVTARARLLAEIQREIDSHKGDSAGMLMDECEIIYDGHMVSDSTDREGTGSHELVELAPDKTTPLWMADGEFVFIDEESCIGCMQCTAAAPSSFRMVDNGRARTFLQKKTPEVAVAVSTCPVNCMHYVAYRELKELETARDEGDGREDHRHFGSSEARGYIGRIPLHVSGIDSDANHRSSWYHYLKGKCQSSHECPQKGCYDCPQYSNPAENPFFQQRLRKANHVRAQYFIKHGVAGSYRKFVDL